jgi:uncharacterized repeat protein (TIGR03803 family)
MIAAVFREPFMNKRYLVLLAAFTFAVALPMFAASSPKGGILYTFKGGSDGSLPLAPLVTDAKGNLYGTTAEGGSSTSCDGYGCGTVFELIAPSSPSGAWQEKVLYAFTGHADGAYPVGGLILDAAGNLYGTTEEGGDLNNPFCVSQAGQGVGCGTVFELSPPINGGPWSETVLHTFEGAPDGELPGAALVFDKSGNLYGTTLLGGQNPTCTCGSVFELSPGTGGSWIETILSSFEDSSDDGNPTSSLVFDSLGNLYGTTVGTVYQLVPPSNGGTWALNTINTFGNPIGFNLAVFVGGLLFDPSGNLFVTTTYSALQENGLAFELAPPESGTMWTETNLHTFAGGGDAHPYGFVEDASGNLYGTTEGDQRNSCGEIFRLSDSGGAWNQAILHSFSNLRFTQGCIPQAPLVYGKWRALYGTTSEGGDKTCAYYYGCGTVFGFLP